MSSLPPAIQQDPLDKSLYGQFGTLGKDSTSVRFVQSVMPIQIISELTLVADLPGSERWPIRQLFQRDIDVERVRKGLQPYLKRPDRIKFFQPLTIAALPIGSDFSVLSSISEQQVTENLDGYEAGVMAEGLYRLLYRTSDPSYAQLKWNSRKVKLVAIDGQHRLHGLQRMLEECMRNPNDPELLQVGFNDWKVPVTLLLAPSAGGLTLLDKTRDIFITINKQAKPPTRCRTILLNDYSITSLCCQELLDHCHAEWSASVPLAFFDWRASGEGETPESPLALVRVEELEDLHIYYLMGGEHAEEELTDDQRSALLVDDMDPPLNETDKTEMRRQLRERYKAVLMPAVLAVFERFKPFATYVQLMREIYTEQPDDIYKHALSGLIFGKHHGGPHLAPQIQEAQKVIEMKCAAAKDRLGPLFSKAVGLRGVFSGLWQFRQMYFKAEVLGWLEITERYVDHLNSAYDELWLDVGKLKHIAVDHGGAVVNYRLEQADSALGAYCALVACVKEEKLDAYSEDWIDLFETLERTILRGYRKEVRPAIVEKNQNASAAKIKELVERAAQRKTESHAAEIASRLGLAYE